MFKRDPRDFAFDLHLDELKLFDFRRDQRERAENFDAASAI